MRRSRTCNGIGTLPIRNASLRAGKIRTRSLRWRNWKITEVKFYTSLEVYLAYWVDPTVLWEDEQTRWFLEHPDCVEGSWCRSYIFPYLNWLLGVVTCVDATQLIYPAGPASVALIRIIRKTLYNFTQLNVVDEGDGRQGGLPSHSMILWVHKTLITNFAGDSGISPQI